MQPDSGIPQAGQIFEGRFRIDGVLGEGGMGVVLRATHALMETPVAIKMLHPALSGRADSIARFLREARNAAAIRSEHVGQVLDVARTESGLPYIVMEFLPGVDLAVLCEERKKLPVAEAATYILQACVAVAEAHALGIVHRDIKPSNLFLTSRVDGSPLVKVFDFGISKRSSAEREDTATLTATGMALGTPSYMSPEQIADAKSVDERADVWSLGTMLYEMLAGRLPFDADTAAAVMAQVATAKPPPLGLLRPDAPEALAALVHACLEKDVNNRIQNVAALAEGLGPFVPEEYQPLVRRVARTREAPGGKAATPALAFRRVLAAAETVERAADPNAAAPADKAAPKTLVAEKAAPKVPVAEEAPPTPPVAASSIAPPAGPDYPRRTFAVAVYVAVLATAAVLVALLRPAAAPTASVVQAAQTAAAGPTALASPPRPAASESATLPSAALSAEPSATASTAASAVTSARPRPSPSTTSTRRLPDDFVVQP